MRPVEQTIFVAPNGDCVRACVASILELPLESVPNFSQQQARRRWYDEWLDWLAQFNLTWISWEFTKPGGWFPRGYCIVSADSRRTRYKHAVVVKDGEIVWDPHPQRAMGVGTWRDVTVFAVLDPSKPIELHVKT